MSVRELEFMIDDWLGACEAGDASLVTLASLRIEVGSGPGRIPVTEVFDTRARTVRQHVNVPLYPIARWSLMNWWRLRWEPQRSSHEWRLAHSMASLGDGYVWPPIEFASDGEFIHVHLQGEHAPDVAAIRYARDVTLGVQADHFEAAVDELVTQVEDRLSACRNADRDLKDLWVELAEERRDPLLARACRWQAQAGIDPGTAPPGWLDEVDKLGQVTGPVAVEEVMALLPELEGGVARARQEVEDVRTSPHTIDMSWVEAAPPRAGPEVAWQKASRLAREFRERQGLPVGPITNQELGERLGVTLPLQKSASGRPLLRGGFWSGSDRRTAVLIPTSRPDNQRFYIARLIGCALVSSGEEHLLPVTDAATAVQKFERAFAQELLCPWTALDAFTDEHGLDDEGIADAAEYFQVSERLVLTTLVNKNKLLRCRLEMT